MIANIRNKVISILLPKLKQFINSIFVNLLTVLFGAVSGLLLLISTGKDIVIESDTIQNKSAPPCLNDSKIGQHSTSKIKGTKLHYVENGDRSQKLVLCLHDFADFWFGWRNQLTALFNSFWVVALDLKGFGDSDKPWMTGNYDDDTIIEEIKIFVETLLEGDQETKMILMGHGLGGHICWKFAQKYPEKVEKLIAISAPHPTIWLKHVTSSWRTIVDNRWVYMCRLPVLAEHKLRKYTRSLFTDRFRDWSKSLDVNFYLDFDQVEDAYNYAFLFDSDWTGPVNYYRNLNLTYKTFTNEDEEDMIGDNPNSLPVETLLMIGNDDPHLSIDLITKSAQIPENCSVHIINGAAHFPHQEQPFYCNKIIYRFIKGKQDEKSVNFEEMNNNDVIGFKQEEEDLGLVQKSLNTLKKLTGSTDKLDKIEEIELDNTHIIAQTNESSGIWNYGASVLTKYRDSVLPNVYNSSATGAISLVNSVIKLNVLDQYN